MKLNNNKFEFLSHDLNTTNHKLTLLKELPFFNELKSYIVSDNIVISPSTHVRDLGVIIDNKLTWNIHYNTICKKAKQLSAWILHTFYSRDKSTMLVLFKSLIRSRLEYCSEIWNPHFMKDINFIEQIQRSFTSKIEGMKDLNYWDRLKSLGLMSLQRRRERLILMHIWKIKNGIYPNTIDLQFRFHSRTGCDKAVLKPLPKVRGRLLNSYEESFIVKSCKLWNILPGHLTKITSLSSFVVQLNLFLSNIPDKPPIPGYPYTSNNSLTEQYL